MAINYYLNSQPSHFGNRDGGENLKQHKMLLVQCTVSEAAREQGHLAALRDILDLAAENSRGCSAETHM